MDTVKQTADINLHFKGENEISAELLCDVLRSFVFMTNKLKDSNIESLEYKIKAYSPGSFITEMTLLADVAVTLISNPNVINYITETIKCVSEFLKLKVFLEGKNPRRVTDEGDRILVENNYGTIQNFFINQITLQDSKLDMCAKKIGESLENNSIPEFSIEENNGESILNLKNKDYEYLTKPINTESGENIIRDVIIAELQIKRPDLMGSSKWDFMFIGRVISAKIEDEQWLKEVRQGMELSGKGKLRVQLRIEAKTDKKGDRIEGTEKYYIAKVINYIQAKDYEQTKMDNEDDLE